MKNDITSILSSFCKMTFVYTSPYIAPSFSLAYKTSSRIELMGTHNNKTEGRENSRDKNFLHAFRLRFFPSPVVVYVE